MNKTSPPTPTSTGCSIAYDASGNRQSEQSSTSSGGMMTSIAGLHNKLNQITLSNRAKN